MHYPSAPKSLLVPLRTGDIVWPNATVHTQVGDDNFSATYMLPAVYVDNQFGRRTADGLSTTWKRIDLSSLMQGQTASKTFRISILERRTQGEADRDGNGSFNPSDDKMLFDTYISVNSSGGSRDRVARISYSSGVSVREGSSIIGGFHAGRVQYVSPAAYVEQLTLTGLSTREKREGTFTVDPFLPFIDITMEYTPIYPQLKNFAPYNLGFILAMVKIAEM